MPSRFWKASGNALLPSRNTFTVSAGAWAPTSLGSNLAVDLTVLSTSNLYTDTAATTNVSADLQTAKAIKDPTTGIIFTNSTGWVYHANSGKPYLQMDGSSWFQSSSFAFTDGSGQYSAWATAKPATNGNNWLLAFGGNTLILANPALNRTESHAWSTTPANLATDFRTGTTLNADAVFSSVCSTTQVECFIDNSGDGATTFSGTLFSSNSTIEIGNTATGPFYGMFIEKGVADSTTKSNAQTYMAALHP
jgi:hypothetical protein